MSDTPKSLYLQRTGVREYVARNQDGAEILVGHGPGRFSPGDLLKLAIAGCNAMSSDARMAARLGEDFEQFVGVSGDYDQQNDRFTHVDVELVQDMSALSDEEIADLLRLSLIHISAQRGVREVEPRERCRSRSLILTTTPSISWTRPWRSAPISAIRSSMAARPVSRRV